MGVPNLTIYLPADLLADVRRFNIAPSATCQQALREKVKRARSSATRAAQPPPRKQTKQQEAKDK